MEFAYRQPARWKKIRDIRPEEDVWVRVAGIVVGSESGFSILDDGTGVARIEGEHSGEIAVLGRVVPDGDSYFISPVATEKIERKLLEKVLSTLDI